MEKSEFNFNNGEVVKDMVSGFQGTITAKVRYWSGLAQYLVTATTKENEVKEIWFDEPRLSK